MKHGLAGYSAEFCAQTCSQIRQAKPVDCKTYRGERNRLQQLHPLLLITNVSNKSGDFDPKNCAEVYMLPRHGGQVHLRRREYGEEKVFRSGDDRSAEAVGSRADVGREMGVSKHKIYAWKANYGGLDVNKAQRLRQIEDENHQLKSWWRIML